MTRCCKVGVFLYWLFAYSIVWEIYRHLSDARRTTLNYKTCLLSLTAEFYFDMNLWREIGLKNQRFCLFNRKYHFELFSFYFGVWKTQFISQITTDKMN